MFTARGPHDRTGAARKHRALLLLLTSALVAGFLTPGPAGAADVTGPGATKLASVVSVTAVPDRKGVVVPGQLVTLTGTVTSATKSATTPITPTGKVRIVINGSSSDGGPTATLDEAGRFTLPEFSLPLLVNPAETVYPLTVSVAYAGDNVFASSASAGTKLSVHPSDTVTTLAVDRSSAPLGKAVVFQARVSGVAPLGQPAGSVSFSVDGTPRSGMVPLDKVGRAAWTSSLNMGSHVVSATYVPVASPFSTSTAELKQTVTRPAGRLASELTVVPVPLKGSTIGFRLGGELRLPNGLPRKGACAGTVTLVLAQRRTRVTKSAPVTGECRYSATLSFPPGVKVDPQGRLTATAAFGGNQHLQPSPLSAEMPLYGGRVSNSHPNDTSPICQNWHLGCRVPSWVVTLGDSYMAGEGGRWAGNGTSGATDALGTHAYDDNLTNNLNPPGPNGSPVVGTTELIPGCHRARSEEVFIGVSKGLNLACSGATTESYSTSWTGPLQFKPGIDFYSTGANRGQARLLSDFASAPSRKINMVVLGIGGNDFGFSDILVDCLTAYLTSQNRTTQSSHWEWYWISWKNNGWHEVDDGPVDHRSYCSDDSNVTGRFSAQNVAAVTAKVTAAFHNAAQAMANQGYGRDDYTIVVQTAPVPIANSSQMRYGQGATFDWGSPGTWLDKPRQTIGGCGFWDKDLDWMTTHVVGKFNATSWQAVQNARNLDVVGSGGALYKPRIEILDVEGAFKGHLLCQGATTNGPTPGLISTSWTTPGSVDRSEWVTQLRLLPAVPWIGGWIYDLQEGFHPDYWGHLALRACVRLAYNQGQPKSGKCTTSGLGLNATPNPDEPKMGLN